MRKTFLVSTSAIALIAGSSLVLAQSQGREAPSPAPAAQQSAPAEKIAPNGAQQMQKSPDMGTTGQGSPSRVEKDRPAGAEAPAGSRESQDRMKSGDPKANSSKTTNDIKTKSDQRAGDKQDATGSTTGQGAAGASGAVNLTQEQRTKVVTTIKQTNVRPVTNVNFNISVGTVVPRSVTLHPLPATIVEVYPAWRGYRFVLVRDGIIIIEPDTYRIVAVIEA